MRNATAAMHKPRSPDEVLGTALSNHVDNTRDLEKKLFDEEVALLEAQATLKTFIGVIATRRVKQRLRKLGKSSFAQSTGLAVDHKKGLQGN